MKSFVVYAVSFVIICLLNLADSTKYFIGKNSHKLTKKTNQSYLINSYSGIKLRDPNYVKSSFLNQNFNLYFEHFEIGVENVTFVFGAPGTLWLLEKSATQTNSVYVSHDNGNSFELFNVNLTSGHGIDDIFSSQFHNFNIIMSDIESKRVFKSNDGGKEFVSVGIPFRLDQLDFTKNQNVILGIENNGETRSIWISHDFAEKWQLIASKVKSNFEWALSENLKFIFFVEKNAGLNSLIMLDAKLESSKQIVTGDLNVLEFQVVDRFIFVLYGKTRDTSNFIVYTLTKGRIQPKLTNLDFQQQTDQVNIKSFQVISVSGLEIFISFDCATKSEQKKVLLRSSKDNFYNFQLSLSAFSLASKSIEMKSLNKKSDLFIANAQTNKKTFIKDIASQWKPIEFAQEPNYYLDLNENFYFSHMYENSRLSRAPQYPEFMLATAVSGDQNLAPFVCLSWKNRGSNWKKLLDGNYLYSYVIKGDNYVILALEKNQPIKDLIYTDNLGKDWTKVKFSNHLVFADELIKEQHEESSTFFLFTSDAKQTSQKSLFKINFKSYDYESNDYDLSILNQALKCEKKCFSTSNPKKEICLNSDVTCDAYADCQDNQDETSCPHTNPLGDLAPNYKYLINERRVDILLALLFSTVSLAALGLLIYCFVFVIVSVKNKMKLTTRIYSKLDVSSNNKIYNPVSNFKDIYKKAQRDDIVNLISEA